MVILEAKEIEKSLWNEPAPDLAPAQAALNAMAPSPLQRAEAAAFNVATRYGEVQGQHGVGQQQLASRGAPAPTSSSTKVLRELEGDAAPTEQGIRVLLISSPLKAHDLLQNLCPRGAVQRNAQERIVVIRGSTHGSGILSRMVFIYTRKYIFLIFIADPDIIVNMSVRRCNYSQS